MSETVSGALAPETVSLDKETLVAMGIEYLAWLGFEEYAEHPMFDKDGCPVIRDGVRLPVSHFMLVCGDVAQPAFDAAAIIAERLGADSDDFRIMYDGLRVGMAGRLGLPPEAIEAIS